MSERPETRAEQDERVRLAEEDRAERAEKAPLTGVLTRDDLLRHLIQYGPGASEAHRAELLAVLDGDDGQGDEPDDGQDEPDELPGGAQDRDRTQDEQDDGGYLGKAPGPDVSYSQPVSPSQGGGDLSTARASRPSQTRQGNR